MATRGRIIAVADRTRYSGSFAGKAAVFSQLRQGILTNFGTPISSNFGRGIASTSAGVNS
jgi:hypothetical protein